jgi:hypothetical protein
MESGTITSEALLFSSSAKKGSIGTIQQRIFLHQLSDLLALMMERSASSIASARLTMNRKSLTAILQTRSTYSFQLS